MSQYRWFVESDDFTNEAIAEAANNWGEKIIPHTGMMCADGKRHNLWECPYSLITKLRNSQQPFRFRAWIQEGKGQIRPFKRQSKHKKTDVTTKRSRQY
jgi:hypothetical protein